MARAIAGRRCATAAHRSGSRRSSPDAAPDGDAWLHEIKFDGYRMHARLNRSQLKLLTRTGLDWTHKYSANAEALSSLGARQAYLDGELCGVGPDGITSFNMIQLASDAGNAAGLVFFLFDLLHLVPVRSSAPRRRRSDGPADDRAQGAPRRAARECDVTPAVLRSSDRTRPEIS
jgi:hypothetical protein